jgi:hypothetical protein
MAEDRAAFGIYPSAGRRPERLNQSRNVNAPLQLARGWAAGLLGLPGDVEGLVRMLPGLDETPRLPTSDFYREYLPGYDERPAARAMSGLAALAGGAGATRVVRGGLGAVKRATDLNAIRDYVRATQGMSGLPGTAVVKPKGGNWISGAGSPEEAVRGLKRPEEPVAIPMDDAEMAAYRAQGYTRYDPETGALSRPDPLNTWIDQKLAKYIRNEMGTPEDPLRALIQERGVSHMPLQELEEGAGFIPDEVARARKQAGYPEIGMVEEGSGVLYGDLSDLQRAASGWETAADTLIRGERAGDLMRLGENSPTIRENPWLAKVPPETPVYSSKGLGEADLGFSHLIDELRNATAATSDLPAELRLKPEQLSKVSMPQAVELVDRINKWREAQAAAATRAAREGIPVQKEYPEGFRWLAAPDTLDPKSLKYVTDVGCEGGWCTQSEGMAQHYGSGGRQLYVLHDPEGNAVVQVAVKPSGLSPYDAWYQRQQIGSPELQEFERYLNQNRDRLRDIKDAGRQGLEVWYEQWARDTGRPLVQPVPEIVEIKGKFNKAPKAEHLPYVQDFVKSQKWGRIGDVQNTGMRPTREVFNFNELQMLKRLGEDYIPDVLSGEDIQRLHNLIMPEGQRLKYDARGNVVGSESANYARGGMVSAAGPAQYDPAHIERLAEQLLMEA